MASATLITDQRNGLQPKLRWTRDGYAGTAHYRVDTADQDAVFEAAGLPAIGSSWSAGYAGVIANELEHVETDGHTSVVRVGYATRPNSWPVGAVPGQRRTIVSTVVASDNIVRAIDGTRLPWNGVSVDFLQYQVEVVQYYDVPGLPLFAAVDPATAEAVLRTPVNSDVLTLPPLADSDQVIELPAGVARYMGYRGPAFEGVGLYSITHVLKVAFPDWKYRYKEEDEQGNVVGDVLAKDVYPSLALMPILA